MRTKIARRRGIVDRTVQGGLVLKILCHWLVFLAVAFFVLTIWQILLSGDPLQPFSTQVQGVWEQSAPMFVALIALMPVFVWDTIKFSHRFAGPLLRLRNSIRSLASGENVGPIKFRKGDFWSDAAEDFNALRERILVVRSTANPSDAAECDPPVEVSASAEVESPGNTQPAEETASAAAQAALTAV